MVTAARVEASVSTAADRVLGGFVRAFAWFTARPWWQQVGVVWALGRVFSVLVVLTVARMQGENPWSPVRPGYFEYIDGWDAGWYHKIYDEGYPSPLPRDAEGHVQTNQWAFYPMLPALSRLVNLVTGVDFRYSAPIIATLASLALCLVMFRLFSTRATAPVALTAVALFSFQPAAPILQFGYGESLGMLLLVGIFLLVLKHRYYAAIPLVLVMSVTRPMAAPLALTLLLLGIGWFMRRDREPVDARRWWGLGVLTAVSGLATFVWPAVAAITTGELTAYFQTEGAWRGDEHPLPGQLWFNIGIRLFGRPFGLLAPILFGLGLIVVMATRTVRRLGALMYLWTAVYLFYLLGTIAPNGSLFRLMMPTFPLFLAASMASSSKAYRTALIVGSMIAQIVWVAWLWHWSGVGLHGARESNP